MKKQMKNKGGFTLIELLIVIGLMGALTALILPTLTANREEALGDVCDYNQAGTVRTLRQYENMVGRYPSGMHNGLQSASGTPEAMEGLPSVQEDHMITDISDTLLTLSANQAQSLAAAGIDSVAYSNGYNTVAVEADVVVAQAAHADGSSAWLDDGGVEMTFDGVLISDWADGSDGPGWNQEGGAGPVVCLWLTPTIDWESGSGDNNDWSKGNVALAIDMEGKCPIPTEAASGDEVSFAYYMAYFKVFDDGSPARLIGSTCPEDGVLNP